LAGLRERLPTAGPAPAALVVPTIDAAYALDPTGASVAPPGVPRILPVAAATLDWHNDRARFLLGLDEMLDKAPTAAARSALLARLTRDLAQ
jgi:metallo-beta-lactamase family protein